VTYATQCPKHPWLGVIDQMSGCLQCAHERVKASLTGVSPEAARRAAELGNAELDGDLQFFTREHMENWRGVTRAFVKHIERVSDVVERALPHMPDDYFAARAVVCDLRALILPKPADPLVEALTEAREMGGCVTFEEEAEFIRSSLAKRGLRVASDGEQG